MLYINLKLLYLEDSSCPPEKIVERLNAISYVQNVTVDLEKNTITFEYGSFRDMDGVVMELKKLGLGCSQNV